MMRVTDMMMMIRGVVMIMIVLSIKRTIVIIIMIIMIMLTLNEHPLMPGVYNFGKLNALCTDTSLSIAL